MICRTFQKRRTFLMRLFATILGIAAGLLAGCATTATMDNDADAQIRAAGPRFIDAFNRADWATVATFYTDDAVALAPHAEIARGPASIQQLFSTFGTMQPRLSFRPDRIEQSGDIAYEYGTYELRMTERGATIDDRGKYLAVWRRMPDGQWKMVADMFNTSLPPPGM
jgi:ketosteroid isomerase-like protein